jgi:hypothetical protein
MRGRTKRLAIAVVLTTVDVATFNRCSGVIWQAWGQYPWARVGLFALLALWISSAAVIWFHISNDVRETLRKLKPALSQDPVLDPSEPRRDSDV